MVDINEVTENIYLIDDQLFSIPKWGCVYLINEERKALIESGPATSVNTVLNGIRKVGISTEDIAFIIVTHIHLDHAGGAGVLLKNMPQAQLLTHFKGARHLVNPTKLISSVVEVMGKEAMIRHGEVLPVELHRVKAVKGGDTIKLGDKQTLKFIDAPGHAPHQLCIYETRTSGLFSGDAVGAYLENGLLLPFHPPPNFNLELCINTLRVLMKLTPTRIYFSHFGVSDSAQQNLQLAIDKLQVWDDIVNKAIREGMFDRVAERLLTQACAELEPIREMRPLHEFLTKVHIPLCVAGHIKYYQDRHKAK